MTQEVLSPAQVEDGFGAYADVAERAGLEIITDSETVPSPDFTSVAFAIAPDEVGPLGAPAALEVPRNREAFTTLGHYPGLRVLVGQRLATRDGNTREVYVPGIVLPTRSEAGFANVGCLVAPNDIQTEPHHGPLSDVQQALLLQVYAMQQQDVGSHGEAGVLNAGDVAHAAVIATTRPDEVSGLHVRTHEMVEVGLAPSLTRNSALDIAVGHGIRRVREGVIGLERAAKIIVVQEHQLPTGPLVHLSVEYGAGSAAVGLTLAAGASRHDPAVDHLAQNLEVMQQEMGN